jgi:dextranase
MTELLPRSATFAEGTSVTVEVRGNAAPGAVVVRYLGDVVATHDYDGSGSIDLGALPVGCYGVELDGSRTAVEVSSEPFRRLRYGFVVDYSPQRDVTGLSDTVRRLHLTGVQFYDWAYRHADLHGGGQEYLDALAQPISLDSVRALIGAVQGAGARALGYAAVYAAGPNEWDDWKHRALLTASGEPYALGDFLFILDPAAPDWLEHFAAELQTAVASLGFDGFHLDQYGYPKRAVRADGLVVDVAESFVSMLSAMRAALPSSTLVFNNVNDFPTWATASTDQDAVYIEPWAPQVTLDSLARVVTRARSVGGGKPIVIAAYQHVYDSAPAAAADLATAFTMATLFSHGATQLLAGEADRILVDPYYVRNHVVESSTAELLRRWYDFVVEHDELLLDPAIVDVTASLAGSYNADLDVTFGNAPVAETAQPGAVWRRITESRGRSIVHLINLVGQTDAEWDAARATPGDAGPATLRVRRVGQTVPRVQVADPDREGYLIDVPVTVDGDYAVAQLPPIGVWQLVLVDPLIEEDAQ